MIPLSNLKTYVKKSGLSNFTDILITGVYIAFVRSHYYYECAVPISPCPFSAATFACIFFLAIKIISSLLFRSKACLSFLFWLHADFPGAVLELSELSEFASLYVILEARLYLAIRSGCTGFAATGLAFAEVEEDDAGTGSGGWKVCGGF